MNQFLSYENFIHNKFFHYYIHIVSTCQIIDSRNSEKHHILPKSLGGTDNKENIILVPYKAHFVLHRLLTKFTKGKDKCKMCLAIISFKNLQYHRYDLAITELSPRTYEQIKRHAYSQRKITNYTDPTIYNVKHKLTGKIITGTRRIIIAKTLLTDQEFYNLTTGKFRRAKQFGLLINGSYTHERKMKSTRTAKTNTCEHCSKTIDIRNYKRWHGDNCKMRSKSDS